MPGVDAWDIILADLRRGDGSFSLEGFYSFMRTMESRAAYAQRHGHDSVTVPADAFKALVEIAQGERRKPRGKPPDRPFKRVSQQMGNPLIPAADDVERLKHIWRTRYGKHKNIHEAALEKAAARWGVDPDKLDNFCRRQKSRI
ncbi:hypothetical protein [Ferruginivarius sediminum]|uniref:Uncharacterized protein n=1 Tax=Ferruginivarius sediminum TaxID=2661937 RepID=A0A369TBD3_9PROT|nr:hypothetical protein [Ferruginivarius sediminum]RDD62633.1 hypothetical protein DRB17_05585 [Ferruginivarius sediminum]